MLMEIYIRPVVKIHLYLVNSIVNVDIPTGMRESATQMYVPYVPGRLLVDQTSL